jgi:hypothetical protein
MTLCVPWHALSLWHFSVHLRLSVSVCLSLLCPSYFSCQSNFLFFLSLLTCMSLLLVSFWFVTSLLWLVLSSSLLCFLTNSLHIDVFPLSLFFPSLLCPSPFYRLHLSLYIGCFSVCLKSQSFCCVSFPLTVLSFFDASFFRTLPPFVPYTYWWLFPQCCGAGAARSRIFWIERELEQLLDAAPIPFWLRRLRPLCSTLVDVVGAGAR